MASSCGKFLRLNKFHPLMHQLCPRKKRNLSVGAFSEFLECAWSLRTVIMEWNFQEVTEKTFCFRSCISSLTSADYLWSDWWRVKLIKAVQSSWFCLSWEETTIHQCILHCSDLAPNSLALSLKAQKQLGGSTSISLWLLYFAKKEQFSLHLKNRVRRSWSWNRKCRNRNILSPL